jgi:hypothetical protein
MSERSFYHFALTLTPPQYKILLEAIEIYAKNADGAMTITSPKPAEWFYNPA